MWEKASTNSTTGFNYENIITVIPRARLIERFLEDVKNKVRASSLTLSRRSLEDHSSFR